MKKMLIAAAVAAMTASGGAWAACTANIDMGNNSILNLADPTNASDAATKAYVDAAGRLEISPISSVQVDGFSGAVKFCQDMDDSGAVDGVASHAGWRLPQNLGEASLGFHRESTVVDISGQPYVSTETTNAPVEGSSIWIAAAVTDGNKPANNNTWTLDNTQWLRARLDGALWAYATAGNQGVFAYCVR